LFCDKVIEFNSRLDPKLDLPENIRVINPFREGKALEISSIFYRKFYNDCKSRRLILGINPGRFGAGVTGVPFTDTKRLESFCGLRINGVITHEPSSVFIYDMISAYGGADAFYKDYYINSAFPLALVRITGEGKEVNFNYYDDPSVFLALKNFMTQTVNAHISMGIKRDVAFCLGTGKNFRFLNQLNDSNNFFTRLIPLEHPRYIMQYKSKQMNYYIEKYIQSLTDPTIPSSIE
jgi:hypothetical protein